MTTLPPDDEPDPEEGVDLVAASLQRGGLGSMKPPPEPPYVKVDDDGTVWVWRHGLKKYIRTTRLDGT